MEVPGWLVHLKLAVEIIQGRKINENPRIHSRKDAHQCHLTKLLESKWILLNISVYHTKLYGGNPWILGKNFTGTIQMDSCTWLQIFDPIINQDPMKICMPIASMVCDNSRDMIM